MSNFTTVETAWTELPAETRDRLLVTSEVAVDIYLNRTTPSEHDSLVAYADLESPPQDALDNSVVREVLTDAGFVFPAAEQTVYVLVENPPPSQTVAGVRVVAPMVALADYWTGNPRMFRYRWQHDDQFAEFAAAHVPADIER